MGAYGEVDADTLWRDFKLVGGVPVSLISRGQNHRTRRRRRDTDHETEDHKEIHDRLRGVRPGPWTKIRRNHATHLERHLLEGCDVNSLSNRCIKRVIVNGKSACLAVIAQPIADRENKVKMEMIVR